MGNRLHFGKIIGVYYLLIFIAAKFFNRPIVAIKPNFHIWVRWREVNTLSTKRRTV